MREKYSVFQPQLLKASRLSVFAVQFMVMVIVASSRLRSMTVKSVVERSRDGNMAQTMTNAQFMNNSG